jgi:hypothetical protein
MADTHEAWVVKLVAGLTAPERRQLFELLAKLKASVKRARSD